MSEVPRHAAIRVHTTSPGRTIRLNRLPRLAGRVLGVVLIGAAVFGVTSAAYADAASDRREQTRYAKETVSLGNGQFMKRKANFLAAGCKPNSRCTKPAPYNRFDWDTDSCSWTPSSWKKLFDPACQQHDFGYRNFGKGLTLGRDESTRKWIDDRFETEMKAICNYKFSDWTQYANLQACFKEADAMHGAVRLISNWSTGSQPAPGSGAAQPQTPVTYAETTGGQTHTWTNPANAGGNAGPVISSNSTVQIACRLTGFKVANGNTWWYRIASTPWNGSYYASADAFYNNGQTSGSLRGTPWVDERVRTC